MNDRSYELMREGFLSDRETLRAEIMRLRSQKALLEKLVSVSIQTQRQMREMIERLQEEVQKRGSEIRRLRAGNERLRMLHGRRDDTSS
jgi:SMC interacting uncharacterized protein involved in chromosome segregation